MSSYVLNILKEGVCTRKMSACVNMFEVGQMVSAIQECTLEDAEIFKPTPYARLGSYNKGCIVDAIRKGLDVCESVHGKLAKSIAASIIMRVVFDNVSFALDHEKFCDTVYLKLVEFMSETSYGVDKWAHQLHKLLGSLTGKKQQATTGFKGLCEWCAVLQGYSI